MEFFLSKAMKGQRTRMFGFTVGGGLIKEEEEETWAYDPAEVKFNQPLLVKKH